MARSAVLPTAEVALETANDALLPLTPVLAISDKLVRDWAAR